MSINDCSGIGISVEGISTNAGNFLIENTGCANCPLGGILVTGHTGGYMLRDVNVEFVNAGVAAIKVDGPTVSYYPAAVTIDGAHIEGLLASSVGILVESARNVHIKDVIYFGSGSTGDLVKITGTTAEVVNVIVENLTASASSVANAIVDTTHNYTLANGADGVNVMRYDSGTTTHHGSVVFKRASDQVSAASITATPGNIIHITGGVTLGTIVTATTEMGKILVVWFAATTTVNDGSSGGGNIFLAGSKPKTFLADDTLLLFSTGTNWIEIPSGPVATDASSTLTIGNLTSGKYPKISTAGLIIDGPTPLAGTKVYYVSDSSGGAVTRKLTFTDGILTAET
jgi:hypothetical protein